MGWQDHSNKMNLLTKWDFGAIKTDTEEEPNVQPCL